MVYVKYFTSQRIPIVKDSEMIAKIKQGETQWLDILIEEHYDGIFRFCYYKTGDREAAYDCTQETFLHLIRYLGNYLEQRKFKAYLYRIARNVCVDYFRKRANVPLGEEALELAQAEDTGIKSVELSDQVMRALERLPQMQRDVVILHFFYGFKLREIAEITDVPMSTAKSRLKQGMDKLRNMEKEELVC